jgi:hypothetical protein
MGVKVGERENRVQNNTGNVFEDLGLPDPEMRLTA